MKVRYFLLPIVIISVMVLVIKSNREVVNKEIVFNDSDINYPFFNDSKIDNYINSYLNDYIDRDGTFIDYDYFDDRGKYYLTFYKNILKDKSLVSSRDSFVIDTASGKVDRTDTNYEFDFVNYKKSTSGSKLVALTFDDGPNYNTKRILDILEKYDAKATFFVLGSKIKGNENTLKRMKSLGMEIGNHTFNHLLLTKYKDEVVKREISSTSDLIFEVTGRRPRILRPSYGSSNRRIKRLSNAPIIIWNIDTLDWKYHNSKRIVSRTLNKIQDGDIVLMHDIYSATANAVNNLIPALKSMGYSFVTVSELFYAKEVELKKGGVYGFAR